MRFLRLRKLCGSLFLLIVGAGVYSLDARLARGSSAASAGVAVRG